MKENSSRLALSKAGFTPTPWSSSWFQTMSISGAAWSRLDACLLTGLHGELGGHPVVDGLVAGGERVGEARERSWVSGSESMPAISAMTGSLMSFSSMSLQAYVPAETPMP